MRTRHQHRILKQCLKVLALSPSSPAPSLMMGSSPASRGHCSGVNHRRPRPEHDDVGPVVATTTRALIRGRAAIAGGGARATETKLAIATIIVAAILRAAPHASSLLPGHPHVEGCQAIVLEVEGAPSAQATHAGEGLPAAGQDHAAGGGDLGTDP